MSAGADLVLPYDVLDMSRSWSDAEKMERTYKVSGKSEYAPRPKNTHRGILAERVLARHLGVPHTPYGDVGEPKADPGYDVWPDLQLRCMAHPNQHWQDWDELYLPIYWKDIKTNRAKTKLRSSRWLLATKDEHRSEVRFYGWIAGTDIELRPKGQPYIRERGRYTTKLYAMVYPDELQDLEPLTDSVLTQWSKELTL